jgi:nicotinamide riboside kinase
MMKIAIVGVHSAGKTTMVNLLAKELRARGDDVYVVAEAGRDCPYPVGANTTIQAQEWIFHEQMLREIVAHNELHDYVLCDRSAMDNIIYLKHLLDGADKYNTLLVSLLAPTYRLTMRDARARFVMLYRIAIEWMETYDVVYRLPFNIEWLVGDGTEDVDVQFAKDIDVMFDEMLPLKAWRWDAETACVDLS